MSTPLSRIQTKASTALSLKKQEKFGPRVSPDGNLDGQLCAWLVQDNENAIYETVRNIQPAHDGALCSL